VAGVFLLPAVRITVTPQPRTNVCTTRLLEAFVYNKSVIVPCKHTLLLECHFQILVTACPRVPLVRARMVAALAHQCMTGNAQMHA
jgi:BarA-like signal transduction histidine kinase